MYLLYVYLYVCLYVHAVPRLGTCFPVAWTHDASVSLFQIYLLTSKSLGNLNRANYSLARAIFRLCVFKNNNEVLAGQPLLGQTPVIPFSGDSNAVPRTKWVLEIRWTFVSYQLLLRRRRLLLAPCTAPYAG